MTAPFVLNVWSPLTTVSAVPGTTPVFDIPGLPVRGATGPVDPRGAGLLADGAGDAEADGAAEPVDPDAEALTAGGSAHVVPGRAAAQPASGANRRVPARASTYGLSSLGIIVPLAHGGSRGGASADHTDRKSVV